MASQFDKGMFAFTLFRNGRSAELMSYRGNSLDQAMHAGQVSRGKGPEPILGKNAMDIMDWWQCSLSVHKPPVQAAVTPWPHDPVYVVH